jgi:hypothetical protein
MCLVFFLLPFPGEARKMAECKWCGKQGFLVRTDENGLCKKCEQHAPLRIIPAAAKIKLYYDAAYEAKTASSKVSKFNAAISLAEFLLPYEKKGIPTCDPLPSAIIEECNSCKDEVIVEEMQQICDKALDRVRGAKSPKGIDAACNSGIKKLLDVSSRLFDQGLVNEYKEKLEMAQRSE